MLLLDLILDPNHVHHRHIIRSEVTDTLAQLPTDSVIADTVSVDSVASVDLPGVSQQLSDVAPLPPKFLGLEGSEILWTVLVVLVALSLCFYFVRMYRRQHHE